MDVPVAAGAVGGGSIAAGGGVGAGAGAAAVAVAGSGFTFSLYGIFEFVKWLIGSAFSIMFVIGPITAYAPQYSDISRGSGEAFSTLVCLVLLLANILRLFFWIGKRFEMVLVYQSIIMIGVQLAMLEVCVRTRSVKLKIKRAFTDWDWSYFWSWSDFTSYVLFLCSFTLGFGVLSMLWIDADWYVEGLGFLALSIESTIGLPQVWSNWKRGPAGLSVWLIGNWLVGDISKTLFYVYLAAPMQFTFSGTIQTVTDLYIIYQIWRWKYDNPQALAAAAASAGRSEGSSGIVIDEHESTATDTPTGASGASPASSSVPLSSISSRSGTEL